MSTHRESAQAPIHSRSEASDPVDERFPLSVARRTISTKGTTNESTPGHTELQLRPGASPDERNDRLMNSVEPTSDTPPPPNRHLGMSRIDGCPECCTNYEPPITSILNLDGGYTNTYTCSDCRHAWTTVWGS